MSKKKSYFQSKLRGLYLKKFLKFSIITTGAGHGFGQYRMDFIQKVAMGGTLREVFFPNAFLAGALNEVTDIEIVFEFKCLFGHCQLRRKNLNYRN